MRSVLWSCSTVCSSKQAGPFGSVVSLAGWRVGTWDFAYIPHRGKIRPRPAFVPGGTHVCVLLYCMQRVPAIKQVWRRVVTGSRGRCGRLSSWGFERRAQLQHHMSRAASALRRLMLLMKSSQGWNSHKYRDGEKKKTSWEYRAQRDLCWMTSHAGTREKEKSLPLERE